MKKKLVESSLGIRTTEATARRIDSALKTLPTTIRRKAAVGIDTEVTDDCDISSITTRTMDRDREIVLPEGIELDDYRLNPIVLFGHDQNKPVGKCLWIKPTPNGLSAKTKYSSRPKNFQGEWHPSFVLEMVRSDVLRGKSIGFLPLEMRDPNEDELAEFPTCQNVITRSLLLEYSVVSVPSNPLALVESIGKGIGLGFWKYEVVGKVRPKKTAPVKKHDTLSVRDVERMAPDADRIAEMAVRNLLRRWEA